MKKRIKSIVANNKTVLTNFSYLTVLQVFTLSLPLISYPYLIRIVGKELYGLTIIAQAFVAFFSIVINFGFDISGVKDCSVNRSNGAEISKIVSSILLAKLSLFLIVGVIYFTVIASLPQFGEYRLLYYISYGYALSEVLLPSWFYQGIEKMKYMTYVNICTKFLFTILVFLVIKSQSQYLWIPGLQIIGSLLGGLLSFYFIFRIESVKFILVPLNQLFQTTKRSFPFFLSRLAAVLSSQTTTLIVGLFLGKGAVADYDLARKIVNLAMIPNSLLNTAVYPKIAVSRSISYTRQVFRLRTFVSIGSFICVLVFAKVTISILGGSAMMSAYYPTLLYSIMIILTGYTYYLGSTVLVSFNYEKKFNLSVFYSLIIYLLIIGLFIVTSMVNIYTLISAVLVSELALLLYRYYYCKKYRIL